MGLGGSFPHGLPPPRLSTANEHRLVYTSQGNAHCRRSGFSSPSYFVPFCRLLCAHDPHHPHPAPRLDSSPTTLFLHRALAWPLFSLSSRLCPQPTNLLIGFYLRPNEVLLYWDNFSKSVTCRRRLHLTFSLIKGEPLIKLVHWPHAS